MATHALAVQGAGGTAALAKTQIGSNIELPAGGPWTIFGLWSQVVKDTAADDESLAGSLIIDSLSGDLTPDPAPGTFPVPGLPTQTGANHGMATDPLMIWPVRWQAAGKSVIALSYKQQLAQAVAAQCAAGIIFGEEVPEQRPIVFCDGVRSTQTSAADTAVGTITLSTRASRITGIFADITVDGAWTVDEAFIGICRLGSADVALPPAQYPLARAFSACDGTPVGHMDNPKMAFIPVDIPVVGGARIDTYIDLGLAVTTACTVGIYLAYE
jgi:hypothetical protein